MVCCLTLSGTPVKPADTAAHRRARRRVHYGRNSLQDLYAGGGNPHRPFTRPCAIQGARETREGNRVLDILFLAVALAFFGLSAAAVRAFDRL